MKRFFCIVALLLAGCAGPGGTSRAMWEKGRGYLREGSYNKALACFAGALKQSSEELSPQEQAELTVDAAEAYFFSGRHAEAADWLTRIETPQILPRPSQVRLLRLRGWIALQRLREGGIEKKTAHALLREARQTFRQCRALATEDFRALLGYGIALYETAKLLKTRTHCAHALAIFRRCFKLNPTDPALLFAQVLAQKWYMGPGTPGLLEGLRRAFAYDPHLAEKAAYRELFQQIRPYRCEAQLTEALKDPARGAYYKACLTLLASAAEKAPRHDRFWTNVRAYFAAYRALTAQYRHLHEAFQQAIQVLLSPDLSAVRAARQALALLEDARRRTDPSVLALAASDWKTTRRQAAIAFLNSLKKKVVQCIAENELQRADELLAEGFALLRAEKDLESQITWAQELQGLKERLSCRRSFLAECAALRTTLLKEGPQAVKEALASLESSYLSCTEQRDFAQLRQEVREAQNEEFRSILLQAQAAAARSDPAEEQRLLLEALRRARAEHFSGHLPGILRRLGRISASLGQWDQARRYLTQIDPQDRSPAAWLLLATALVREGNSEQAFSIFSRKDLYEYIPSDPRYQAGAGMTFAAQGKSREAIPLLHSALRSVNVPLPFARSVLEAAFTKSLTAVLNEAEPLQPYLLQVAETYASMPKAEETVVERLGEYFYLKRSYKKAYRYLQQADAAGAAVPQGVLARLRAYWEDYAPLGVGLRWKYRQSDGQELEVVVEEVRSLGRYQVVVRSGESSEKQLWEKRGGGKVLCRFFGEQFRRAHHLPVGLTDPAGDSPPEEEPYQLEGRTWRARIAKLDESVTTEAGRWRHCLVVEVRPPESEGVIQYFFAPAVGEVAVKYPGDQAPLSRTLIEFHAPATLQSASRSLHQR